MWFHYGMTAQMACEMTVKKTVPILRLKIADLHQINGKSLFYVRMVPAHLGTRFDISRNFI